MKFTVVVPGVDESSFSTNNVNPCRYARKLALAKAKDVAVRYPESLVVGADTIVDFDGQIIGKPADAKDAERITTMLFSKAHKVITAVAMVRLSVGLEVCESDSTTVYPKKLSRAQIAEHIQSRLWEDKAGAYAIQENGDEFVEKIEGSVTNVMGLPMELLMKMLKDI